MGTQAGSVVLSLQMMDYKLLPYAMLMCQSPKAGRAVADLFGNAKPAMLLIRQRVPQEPCKACLTSALRRMRSKKTFSRKLKEARRLVRSSLYRLASSRLLWGPAAARTQQVTAAESAS